MAGTYFYHHQLKRYALMFASMFADIRVRTGLNGCGEVTELSVPISYASKDRVVAAMGASNTQNKLFTVPMMSLYLTGIQLAPERVHGKGLMDRRPYLPQGAVFPDDVKVAYRMMPVPYDLEFEVSIIVSNTDQAFQVLEQLLTIFGYDLQLQKSDAPFDWTKISKVELVGINNEEQIPMGTDRRQIVWTLSFRVEAYLSLPMDHRDDIIKGIRLRIGDLSGIVLNEIDESGDQVAFIDGSMFTDDMILPPEGPVAGPSTQDDHS